MIVGDSFDDNSHLEAVAWEGGTVIALGFIDPAHPDSQANGVSGDGSVVVGLSLSSNGHNEAFRWENGAMVGLDRLDTSSANSHSVAQGVSFDGTVVVGGSTSDANGVFEATSWDDGGTHALGFLGPLLGPSQKYSEANAASRDGLIIVGASVDADGHTEAFKWTAGVMEGLGFLPGPQNAFSEALAISADGATIVGTGGVDGQVGAVRWTDADGMESVATLLTDAGVDLGAWDLQDANGVSATGAGRPSELASVLGRAWA